MQALEIAEMTAKRLNLDKTLVVKVYKNYWLIIKDLLEKLPLKEDLSKEEFDSLIKNVNIPSIGKLYVDWEFYCKIKRSLAFNKKEKYDDKYKYQRD